MQFQIIGQTVPVVEVRLNAGESMYSQRGGMAYQTEGIVMNTNARGGLMKSLGRAFAGESMFMANFTAQRDGAMVAFATTVPGNIMPVDISQTPGGLIFQKGSFLCAENGVETSITFTKKISAGFVGGEGFILQRAQGRGMLFLEVDGDAIVKNLMPGEVLKVDTGNVVGFEPSVTYSVEMVSGIGNIFLGGGGLFLTKLAGPGRVILQSQNLGDFAGRINSYGPNR